MLAIPQNDRKIAADWMVSSAFGHCKAYPSVAGKMCFQKVTLCHYGCNQAGMTRYGQALSCYPVRSVASFDPSTLLPIVFS
jgi:hypothetical protein